MRKAKRSDMPGGFTRRKPPIEIDGFRADSIHNPSRTEHEVALEDEGTRSEEEDGQREVRQPHRGVGLFAGAAR